MSVSTQLPEELRNAAWVSLGIAFNPVAAFQKKAKELNLGRPVTNELRVVINGMRWAFQCYEGGILGTEEGNWGDIRKLDWL